MSLHLTRRSFLGSALASGVLACGPDLGLITRDRARSPQSMPAGIGTRTAPRIYDVWPRLAQALPWISLGELPTPVTRLRKLEAAIGYDGELWLKREDLASKLYGGNKVRKMEFLLADALAVGADSLLSIGGIGSHQCLATGVLAKQYGLHHGSSMFRQPVTEHVRQNLRYEAWLGTEIHYHEGTLAATANVPRILYDWSQQGRNPYFVYFGASTAAGSLGYVDMMFELRDQIRAGELDQPDHIFAAAGSLGTLAGMIVGRTAAGLETIGLTGVRITERVAVNGAMIESLAQSVADLLSAHGADLGSLDARISDYTLEHAFYGGAYGQPTIAGVEARKLLLDTEGILLEDTYTAKTLAAMLDFAQSPAGQGKHLMMIQSYNGAPYPSDLPGREALPAELQWVFDAPLVEPV